MNRCIRLLPFFIGVLVLGACSQIKGYRIDGSAPLPEFEGKMVYMKDVSTDAPVDSARIINGKFAFADTTKIENPVIKQYIANPQCTIILFENPPYAETTSAEHQRQGQSKKSSTWKQSYVVTEMKKEVKGTASNDLGNVFIWSGFKLSLIHI